MLGVTSILQGDEDEIHHFSLFAGRPSALSSVSPSRYSIRLGWTVTVGDSEPESAGGKYFCSAAQRIKRENACKLGLAGLLMKISQPGGPLFVWVHYSLSKFSQSALFLCLCYFLALRRHLLMVLHTVEGVIRSMRRTIRSSSNPYRTTQIQNSIITSTARKPWF